MRAQTIIPLLLILAGGTASIAVGATNAAVGDDVLKPESVRMMQAGQAALGKGDASVAIDNFEAALASDPKNVGAFVGIAQSYEKLGLPGKSVKYYREALALNPSDLGALEGQGKVLIARGATARAQINLARIKALCKLDCSAATRLQTALNTAVAAADAPAKSPPVVKN